MPHLIILGDVNTSIAKLNRLKSALIAAHDYYHDNESTMSLGEKQSFDDAFDNAASLMTEIVNERAAPSGLTIESVCDELEKITP